MDSLNENFNVSVVIVAYNNGEELYKCIDSIFDIMVGIDFEIVIFDNGVNSLDLTRYSTFVQVRYHKSKENLGFGVGVNNAVAMCKYENILLINPDAYLVEASRDLLKFIYESQCGVVSGVCFDKNLKLRNVAGLFPNKISRVAHFKSRLKELDFSKDKFCEVDYSEGSLYIFNRSLFNLVGGFDRNIFLYGEDYELSYRFKAQGLNNYVHEDIKFCHAGGYNNSREHFLVSGILYFNRKHSGRFFSEVVRMVLIVRYVALICVSFFKDRSRLDTLLKCLAKSMRY